jgi:hypothetical protein
VKSSISSWPLIPFLPFTELAVPSLEITSQLSLESLNDIKKSLSTQSDPSRASACVLGASLNLNDLASVFIFSTSF